MATYLYGHPMPRTARQGTKSGRDAELLRVPTTLVGTRLTRLSRRERAPYPWFGLLWPPTSMATPRRGRTASARGPVGMRNCWRDPRHWIAPTTPACRVGDARHTSGLDFYGHPVPCTDRQCTRPCRDGVLLGGLPTLVCTHHTRTSRRGRKLCSWFAHLPPHTSMATEFRARTARARGPVGIRKCWGDPRHWFARTTTAGRVGDARRTRSLHFYGHILLWPANSVRTPPMYAAR